MDLFRFEPCRGTQVFRLRPDGRGVQQVTHNGGEYGHVSADGKWLYCSVPGKGLWKMPPDGGEATQVLPRSALLLPLTFAFTARGI
jgi:Tol biopolymer transport system component